MFEEAATLLLGQAEKMMTDAQKVVLSGGELFYNAKDVTQLNNDMILRTRIAYNQPLPCMHT